MFMRTTPGKKDYQPNLSGFNLYQDEKGRTLYHTSFHKSVAYYIAPIDFKTFNMYQNRFFFSLALGILVMTFIRADATLSASIGIAAGLIAFAVFQFKFNQFLQKCSTTRFDPSKLTGNMDVNAKQDYSTMILKIVLYLILGILLVVNAYMQNFSLVLKGICWFICIVCALISMNQIRYILYKKNHNL